VKTEVEIRAAIRLYAKTIYHPVGTCRMGVDAAAVVDPETARSRARGAAHRGRVDHAEHRRRNTNAPSIMIGEKAADIIAA